MPIRALFPAALLAFATLAPTATAAAPLTACGVVSADDAKRLLGAPMASDGRDRLPTANGPGTYDSVCTYFPKGSQPDDLTALPRAMDVTLHVLDSAAAAARLFDASVVQYRDMTRAADSPYKGATLTPLTGLGQKAMLLELPADASGFRAAFILFLKGKVAGTVSAWSKPAPSATTVRAAAAHVLGRLP